MTPEGARILRRYHEATLAFADRRATVKFVFDPEHGRFVLPVEPGAAAMTDLVLHIPHETAPALQVMISHQLIPRPEASAPCDRWVAYHLYKPASAAWITARPEGAKNETAVFAADELLAPNPIRADEPRLLKAINADPARLGRACGRLARVEVADPLAVGVDADGIDVRARFGIIRIEFPESAVSADEARGLIAGALGIPRP